MKDFDNSLVTLLSLDEATLSFLVSIQVNASTTLYRTTYDVPILWDGNLYEDEEISLETFNYTADLSVDEVSMKVVSVDLSWPSIILNNDMMGNEVYIYFGGFSSGTFVAEPLFRGIISHWKMDETEITFTISNELILWNKKALRSPDVLCQWGFGETECGYTGDLSGGCNKTYEQCTFYGNTANFGGFRFIAAIEENDIWWGKQRV